MPEATVTFIDGIRTMTTAGDVQGQSGMAAHVYVANASMVDEHFFNADGELLIVPEAGNLRVVTEMGVMDLEPSGICVIAVAWSSALNCRAARRGATSAKITARIHSFRTAGPLAPIALPTRAISKPLSPVRGKGTPTRLRIKWCGRFHETTLPHSPLDVVAWHGNYAPYKYDLRTYAPVGAIRFDHPDPSIFTVLTAPFRRRVTANIDFVIFPPRWQVAEHSFRPPWYHRNIIFRISHMQYHK